MTKYASTTTVSREKSIAEIDNILRRYGADAFSYAWQGSAAMIMFQIAGRRIRFMLPMPEKSDLRTFRRKNAGYDSKRTDIQSCSRTARTFRNGCHRRSRRFIRAERCLRCLRGRRNDRKLVRRI